MDYEIARMLAKSFNITDEFVDDKVWNLNVKGEASYEN